MAPTAPRYEGRFIDLDDTRYATLYGSAGIGTSNTQGSVCYGAVCGAELFAQLEGPYVLTNPGFCLDSIMVPPADSVQI
jgi:hypothetical protein